MKAFLLVAIIILLTAGSLFFLSQTNNIRESPQDSISSNLSNTKEVKGSSSQDSQELPPCPSETATGCRKLAKGEKSSIRGCTGEGTVNLISPMKYEDIGMIIPMGATIGGHVTPIDHMYFQPIIFNSPPDSYDVYADADGVIVSIGLEGKPINDNPGISNYNKYRIVIYHTCDFYSIYNLITSLSPAISEIVGEITPGSTKEPLIKIKKGDLLGRIGGQTLDLSVNYDKVILPGFLEPKSYEGEPWKIHTVDPFDYWSPEVREKLMEKNIRTVPPYGGKIDYDKEGRLVGNWFVENTNGYRGINPSAYWDTHLSFVYNEIDPPFIILSLGNFGGEAKQFAVKGNIPDPADVELSTGLVKYELVDFYYTSNGQMWDRMSMTKNAEAVASDQIKGTVLVKLLDIRKIEFEVFPDKSASEVQGFTSNSKVYTR